MNKEEEKLKKEVEQFYKNKKTKENSSLQQEADDFINRKTRDGQEKQLRQD
tara:strand:+ start:256 stop:408 length:153 start_codon:yes stop_codon:yes gene_type:complete